MHSHAHKFKGRASASERESMQSVSRVAEMIHSRQQLQVKEPGGAAAQ